MKLNLLDVYSKAIPSRVEIVRGIVGEIIQYLLEHCKTIHEDVLFELKVILNELILNAIIHGNKENKDKLVEINAGITKSNYLVLAISDEGEGYDYNSCLKRCEKNVDAFSWCDMEEKGRGIQIVRGLCDNIRFNKEGNEIYIVKNLEKQST